MKTEILAGVHPVAEALAAGRRRIYEILVSERKDASPRIAAIKERARAQTPPVPLTPQTTRRLDETAGHRRHQGIAARVSPYPEIPFEELLPREVDASVPPFLLLIDDIVDVHNLGALVRSALCAGVTGVIVPKDRSAPPSPAVSRVSAGALEHIRFCRVTNLAVTVESLKKAGVWVFGLASDGSRSIYTADLTGPLALVVGGEEKGIRPLVRSRCDMLLSIPLRGPLGSLNASVAGAVALFEAVRRRSASRGE
jgi:23S rRNA (guanosine2251-2'-O)-methyltransferase